MENGYIEDMADGRKYGIARENILSIQDLEPGSINPEMLERIVSKYEADGIKFKYEKSQEWKDAGYEDPNAD